MNDKLKQSLEGRLNGMRWGEREQAEVFRQIQRKELQDVKQVKRGTGMLAIAMAVLFLVMGAAFALDQLPQPEDTTLLTQPSETEFIPMPMARYENDYLTLTIDNASWVDNSVSIDVTLRLKEPEKYALTAGFYSNPGSAARQAMNIDMNMEIALGDRHYAATNEMEIVDMTTDSAVLHMSMTDLEGLDPDSETLPVSLRITAETTQPLFSADVDFSIPRDPASADGEKNKRLWLFENALLTGYHAESRIEGEQLYVAIDVVPRKPWYVINTSAPDKSTLTVRSEWFIGYENETPLLLYARNAECTPTEDGARITAVLPFPSEYQSIRYSVHINAVDAMTGSECESPVISRFSRAGSQTAAAPAPTPTPTEPPVPEATATPAPEAAEAPTIPLHKLRSEPTGEHIGGNDLVSIFLEDSWYDGFSAEATLRIRVDDGVDCQLAVSPNENGIPLDTTWVVQLAEDEYNYKLHYRTTCELTREELTGDVLVHIIYTDPHNSGTSNQHLTDPYDILDLTIPISMTNERTWEKQREDVLLEIKRTCALDPKPLYLVDSTEDVNFLQGSLLTTDRYHYIGMMFPEDGSYIPTGHLLDENGEILATGSYIGTNGNSLTIFPRVLFPYDGDADSEFNLLVIRVDKAVELPEAMPVRLDRYVNKEMEPLLLTLSQSEPVPHEQVSIVLDANVLFDNEYVTISFVDADYGHGHAMAQLYAELKEPDKYTFVENDPNRALTYLDMELGFNAYEYRTGVRVNNATFAVMTEHEDSGSANIYIHGSSDRWLETGAPVITARLALKQAGSIPGTSSTTEHTAEFTFPDMGRIDLYDLIPTDAVDAEHFTYVGGQLVATEYLHCTTLQYRCSDPYQTAFFYLSCEGTPLYDLASINNQSVDPASDASLRQSTIYSRPSWYETIDEYAVTAQDFHSPTEFSSFSVKAVPIDNTP